MEPAATPLPGDNDVTETLLLFRNELEREIERRARDEARAARPRGLRRLLPYLPLLPVLAVQSLLATRLMSGRSASVEEAADLFAGHMEIGHLLHGTTVSNYPTFFSGAPTLYPVAAALADAAHGLFGARCLSLLCMLLATAAVYKTGRRIYGVPTAVGAAALFSVLGPTLHLSSYATFDAPALCLLAWSLYYTVAFAHGDSRNALIYAIGFMVLADCVKYAVLLWNPLIVAMVAAAGPGMDAWKVTRSWNVQRFGLLAASVLGVALLAGREPYFTGLTRTAKLTVDSNLLRGSVLSEVDHWFGVLFVLALAGFLTLLPAARRDPAGFGPKAGAAGLLLCGGLIAPLYQLLINSNLSLDKQTDIGAVFAAVPAGWLLARIAQTARQPQALTAAVTAVFSLAVAVPMGIAGVSQATSLANAWPNSTQMISMLRPLVARGKQNYLVEDAAVAEYALGGKTVKWTQWHDTAGCTWSDGTTFLTGAAACSAAISANYYSIIVLDYAETPKLDAAIFPTISHSGYRLQGSYSVPTSLGTRTYSVWALVG
ncbi:glycosyltransferase family 39 protein [Actinospica durhamensis]|uniref:Glycosyltransferase family 39 protein n=1 Tax=Actinospica durhamensis TaxID=1508375 RepID=A0A941IPW8_9ACTN|nr:glycosyltransferase family 39 protein [Actinospica durhamensis]MBR7832348.1 glycosyltransferase family 39 protein [Actinospica durhamensis]